MNTNRILSIAAVSIFLGSFLISARAQNAAVSGNLNDLADAVKICDQTALDNVYKGDRAECLKAHGVAVSSQSTEADKNKNKKKKDQNSTGNESTGNTPANKPRLLDKMDDRMGKISSKIGTKMSVVGDKLIPHKDRDAWGGAYLIGGFVGLAAGLALGGPIGLGVAVGLTIGLGLFFKYLKKDASK